MMSKLNIGALATFVLGSSASYVTSPFSLIPAPGVVVRPGSVRHGSSTTGSASGSRPQEPEGGSWLGKTLVVGGAMTLALGLGALTLHLSAAESERRQRRVRKLAHEFIEEARQRAQASSKIPEEYVDPISQELMSDPVITADGHTYERAGIERWLAEHDTSPLTNIVLGM